MPLDIKIWNLQEFKTYLEDDRLDLSPEFQRRAVWTPKKRMGLIDSLARKVPIGAITVFATRDQGYTKYDVIDGKQRLSAFEDYIGGSLVPESSQLRDLADEEEQEGKEEAEKLHDNNWDGLNMGAQSNFLEYEIPVYVVTGSRASAVRAFARMNKNPTALNSQELRNAIWKDGKYLAYIKKLEEDLDGITKSDEPLLVDWGLYSPPQYTRMIDVQFLSELVALALDGPQEARRTLDDFYTNYDKPKAKPERQLKTAVAKVQKAISLLYSVIGDDLRSHSFNSENFVYSLIGAICRGNFTKAQISNKKTRENLDKALRAFGNQVIQCKEALAENEDITIFGDSVRDFATSLAGGQVNSKTRRTRRLDIFYEILTDFLKPTDTKKISAKTRELVWGRSVDKKCGRCGKIVAWKDYHCGHINSRARGGSRDLDNLQVEHAKCNQKAGAT